MALKPTRKRIRTYGCVSPAKPSGGYHRVKSDDRYHSWRWTKESKAFREEHPLCAECLKKGLLVPSKVVDHIIPVAICEDFWDQDNWQSLCSKCNADKGNRDKTIITKIRNERIQKNNRTFS